MIKHGTVKKDYALSKKKEVKLTIREEILSISEEAAEAHADAQLVMAMCLLAQEFSTEAIVKVFEKFAEEVYNVMDDLIDGERK